MLTTHSQPSLCILLQQVAWLRDDEPIELSERIRLHYNNTLEIRNAQYADRGEYTCQAVNGAGIAHDSAAILIYGAICVFLLR